jgi:purine-binding chemotaxis protein CheW
MPSDSTTELPLENAAPREPLLLLAAGGRRLALPLGRVREIVTARPITRLPGAESGVAGLVNVRGRMITVLDLGTRLGAHPATDAPGHRVVVLEHRGRSVGLAVEEVLRILQADPTSFAPPEPSDQGRDFLKATGRVEEHAFTVLDPDSLFHPVFG